MNERIKGHMLACMTILIWGTTFISTKVLLRDFTPLQILFTRFMIGYLALWAVAPRLTRIRQKKEELYFLAAGLCGVTLYFLMEYSTYLYTGKQCRDHRCCFTIFYHVFRNLAVETEASRSTFFHWLFDCHDRNSLYFPGGQSESGIKSKG